jgi:ATP-dependent DNA helicase DinG
MGIADILGPDGTIARRLASYETRPQQLAMAEAVAAAFDAGKHLIIEAGTGVGKSFAYLVPAIERVLAHGGRVAVSTHTIALQEQLIHKDIPFLRTVLGDKFSAVLVKGRSNYLGLRRLARASGRQDLLFETTDELAELHTIEDWAYKTTDGSLADLPRQPGPKVWERARSDADDCLGRKCPHYDKCFYQRARRKAQEAQILIVNHALLFSDLAVRAQGASILPDYDFLILDEAHTIEGVAGDHLGLNIADAQVRYLLNTLHHERSGRGVLQNGVGRKVVPAVNHAHRTLDNYFGELGEWAAGRGNWNGRLREPPPIEQRLAADLLSIHDGLRAARGDTKDEEERSELAGLSERCTVLAAAIDNWHQQKTAGWVYWIETGEMRRQRVTLAARPVDVGPLLREALFDEIKSVVLTSATLNTSTETPFGYIRGRLSLDDSVRGVALGSPFNYQEQLTVYVEADLPDPANGEAFSDAACATIKKYVKQTAGRAFVLFTSYEMLRRFAERLAGFFEAEEMPLLVHGSGMPRSKMLEVFRTTPRSVLFGTDTFWMGVDVPGEALSNVIIVKLPFAAPNQPIVEARIERIREQGGNPFMDFQLPEAVLKFKQGVGRLIRTKTDTGIVVILDPRVVTKRYGKRFLEALPECKVIVQSAKQAGTPRLPDEGNVNHGGHRERRERLE